jgi:hypothetical protein
MDPNKFLQVVPLLPYYPSWLQWTVAVVIVLIFVTGCLLLIYLPSALRAKTQIVKVEYSGQQPFIDKSLLRIDRGNRRWETYFFRVRLVNRSEATIVRVRELKLSEFAVLDGNGFRPWKDAEDLILEWDESKPKEIPAGGNVFAQFARVFPPDLQKIRDGNLTGSVDIPQIVFTVIPGGWPMKMISKVPPGTHRFKLTAYFENAPPAGATILLKCPTEQDRPSVEAFVKTIESDLLKVH